MNPLLAKTVSACGLTLPCYCHFQPLPSDCYDTNKHYYEANNLIFTNNSLVEKNQLMLVLRMINDTLFKLFNKSSKNSVLCVRMYKHELKVGISYLSGLGRKKYRCRTFHFWLVCRATDPTVPLTSWELSLELRSLKSSPSAVSVTEFDIGITVQVKYYLYSIVVNIVSDWLVAKGIGIRSRDSFSLLMTVIRFASFYLN